MTWDAVPGATSYDIGYTNDGQGRVGDKIDTVFNVTGANRYTISEQVSGDNICFRIRAVNSYGTSPWSASRCGPTPG